MGIQVKKYNTIQVKKYNTMAIQVKKESRAMQTTKKKKKIQNRSVDWDREVICKKNIVKKKAY